MTRLINRITGDQDGSVAVEAALVLPVLFIFFGAIIQLGLAIFIQVGVDHATGEAARYATIYPSPTNSEIEDKARNSTFGGDANTIRSVTVVRGIDDGRKYAEITMTYDHPVIDWFLEGSSYSLSQTRRAYMP